MKMTDLKKKLTSNRTMSAITLRMPEDVVDELKKIAPLLGFSGYQPLIRTYIGKCLREDLEKLDNNPLSRFLEALRHQGVKEEYIKKAIKEIAA